MWVALRLEWVQADGVVVHTLELDHDGSIRGWEKLKLRPRRDPRDPEPRPLIPPTDGEAWLRAFVAAFHVGTYGTFVRLVES